MRVPSLMPRTAAAMTLALSLAGCGTANNDAPNFNSTTGQHSVGWVVGPASHRKTINPATDCAGCHGAAPALAGGAGPACTSCHTLSPVTNLNCTSCHGNPPGGTTAPDIQGAHGTHNALNNITGVCSTCHNGAGIGTVNHVNGTVNVAFPAAFDAKTGGAAAYAPGTGGGSCANISCHGGITTPPWQTGTINPATDCTSCHQSLTVSDQYNSYFSGQHEFHILAVGLSCTDCHDATKLAVSHFVGLNTPAFEGDPATTIRDDVAYVGGSCTPNTGGFCHLTAPITRPWL